MGDMHAVKLIDANDLPLHWLNDKDPNLSNREAGFRFGWNGARSVVNNAPAFDFSKLWINVKDELPNNERDDWVLAIVQEKNGYRWIPHVMEYRANRDDWYCEGTGWLKDHNGFFAVTHWMPLPELPKEENNTEPVQHGRWVPNSPNNVYQCSVCGFGMLPTVGFQDGNCLGVISPSSLERCPQCGAKMDTKEPSPGCPFEEAAYNPDTRKDVIHDEQEDQGSPEAGSQL